MYAIAAADLEARVLKVVKGFDRVDASKVSLASLFVQFRRFSQFCSIKNETDVLNPLSIDVSRNR